MASGTFHCSSQERPEVTSANTRPSSREIRRAGKAKQQAIIVALRRQLHEYDQKFAVMEMVIRDQQLEIHALETRLGRAGCHNAVYFDLYDRPDVHDAAVLTDISLKIGDSNASCVPPPSGILDAAEGSKLAQSEFVVEQVTASSCGPEGDLAAAEVEPLPGTAAFVATSGSMVGMLIHKPTVQYIDKRVPNKVIQYTDEYLLTSACGCLDSGLPAPADVAAGNALEHPMDSNGTPGHIKAAEPPGTQVPGCADFAHNSKIEKSRAPYSEGGDDNETRQSQCGRQATVHHRPCATSASPELIDTSVVVVDFNSKDLAKPSPGGPLPQPVQTQPVLFDAIAPESDSSTQPLDTMAVEDDFNSQYLALSGTPGEPLPCQPVQSASQALAIEPHGRVQDALAFVKRNAPRITGGLLAHIEKFAISEFYGNALETSNEVALIALQSSMECYLQDAGCDEGY